MTFIIKTILLVQKFAELFGQYQIFVKPELFL